MIPANSKINLWPTETEFKQLINENQETDSILFRWEDLSEKGKRKLILALKRCSPIYTVKKKKEHGGITLKEMYQSFKITNPIIIENYRNTFSGGSITSYMATRLSRIPYYICRRNPSDQVIEQIKRNNATRDVNNYWRRQDNRDATYMNALLEEYQTTIANTPEAENDLSTNRLSLENIMPSITNLI